MTKLYRLVGTLLYWATDFQGKGHEGNIREFFQFPKSFVKFTDLSEGDKVYGKAPKLVATSGFQCSEVSKFPNSGYEAIAACECPGKSNSGITLGRRNDAQCIIPWHIQYPNSMSEPTKGQSLWSVWLISHITQWILMREVNKTNKGLGIGNVKLSTLKLIIWSGSTVCGTQDRCNDLKPKRNSFNFFNLFCIKNEKHIFERQFQPWVSCSFESMLQLLLPLSLTLDQFHTNAFSRFSKDAWMCKDSAKEMTSSISFSV